MILKIRVFPQEIATQIVLLLIASAVIFHACISAAFFIGRNYSPLHTPPEEIGYITHIADFMKMAGAQPIAMRDQMIGWLASADPHLDLKKQPPPDGAKVPLQGEDSLEAIQNRVGPQIRVARVEENNRQRVGFQFEDGTYFSLAMPPPMPGYDPGRPPPSHFEGQSGSASASQNSAGKSGQSDALPPPGQDFGQDARRDSPPVFPLVFGTLLFIAISFTIFLLWAVRAIMRPLRGFATSVDAFTVDGTMTSLEENGPSELRGAARALNRMHERVKAMIEQRTQMLAAVSHDLRTPITRMRLRAEFIEQNDVREPILRDIEQMDAMVHSALSFIRDGVVIQRNALLDLSALLQTVCDEFADMGHRVTYENAAPLSINGNADELYRAVTNLLSNAVRFGTEVEVCLRPFDDAVEIDVIDNGPGIPQDQKAAMLAPFARGDASRPAENLHGFGLGLPIVQAIVNAHHGSLTLLDRQPHGLIAHITLPRS